MPIAIYEKMDPFTCHELTLQKGDTLYLFTDGFPDQFGGPKGKKYKYKPFKRLLAEISERDMNEQEEAINKTFKNWLNSGSEMYEQVDDVTVLGIRI